MYDPVIWCIKMYKAYILYLILIVFGSSPTMAIIYGSFSSSARLRSTLFFPQGDADNEVRGFSYLENGLALEKTGATCDYNAYQVIAGNIALNQGTLRLEQDCTCVQGAEIFTGGTIDGNNHALHFVSTATIILPFQNQQINTNWLEIDTSLDFSDNIHSVDWSFDDRYLCVGFENGDITIYSFSEAGLQLVVSTNLGTDLEDLRWHPSEYYLVATGQVSGSANEVRVYYFDPVAETLTSSSGFSVNAGTTVHTGVWRPDGNFILTNRSTNPEIAIYPFSTTTGLGTAITYNITNSRTFNRHTAAWHPAGTYFVLGYINASGDEVQVFEFDGTTITERDGVSRFRRSVYSIDWSSRSQYIAVGMGRTNPSSSRQNAVELYEYNPDTDDLSRISSGTINTGNYTRWPLAVAWSYGGDYLCMGRAVYPGEGGTEFRVYSFDVDTETFSLVGEEEQTTPVNSVRWTHDNRFIARGNDAGGTTDALGVHYGYSLNIGPLLTFIDVSLSLAAPTIINAPVMFQGNSVVNCKNNVLEIVPTATLILDANASVLIENAVLKDVHTGKLILGNNSTLALRNVCLQLDDDYTFTQGAFEFYGDVIIKGPHIFEQKSSQTSTIGAYSTLFFDSGMTFSYASTAGRDLLAFADKTAILHFFETALYSVVPGMQLKKGTLVVEGACPVINNATTKDDGVLLGDGVSSDNDVDVKILPESGFDVRSGYLTSQLVASP